MRRLILILFVLAIGAPLPGWSQTPQAQGARAIDILSIDPDHEEFIRLLLASEVKDRLNGIGPFTVLAPTDEAFQSLPLETFERIITNPAARDAMLRHHIIQGRVPSEDLQKVSQIIAIDGNALPLRLVEGSFQVGGAPIVEPDIPVRNGLIHAIGEVMSPERSKEILNELPPTPTPKPKKGRR